MFGLETLDVLIGLMTVYFTFGIACTAIIEVISSWFSLRSKNLEVALNELFSGELSNGVKFIDKFFEHPLIQSLSKGNDGRPSYIPQRIVGQVVESLIMAKIGGNQLSGLVASMPGTADNNRIKGILETLLTQTGDNADQFRDAIEKQFDAVMERASGWYKRQTQTMTLMVAFILVLCGNVDTINIATMLASNPVVREKTVTMAQQNLKLAVAQQNQTKEANNKQTTDNINQAEDNADDNINQKIDKVDDAQNKLNSAVSDMQATGLSFGWGDEKNSDSYPLLQFLKKVVGLLITTFAISLGGPFWFDILDRVMRIRSTGPKLPLQKNGK